MRIVLMLNNNPYNNLVFSKLCKKFPENIIGIVISKQLIPGKNVNLVHAALQFLKISGYKMFFMRMGEMLSFKLKYLSKYAGIFPESFDIFHFCRKHNIPIIRTDNVNSGEFLETFKQWRPDLVFSRINQIFKREILQIPRFGMVNCHSSLLPKYQGIDGVFWGMANNDKKFGTTVHFISEKLDGGDIIAQKTINNVEGLSLHCREFILNEISGFLLLDTLKLFLTGGVISKPMETTEKSYYSFANREGMTKFKKNGHILISCREILSMFLKSRPGLPDSLKHFQSIDELYYSL